VIISDEEIGSPLVQHPRAAIVMNRPSLDKYEPLVRPGGLLIVNASMAGRAVERTDLEVVALPASEMAEALGDRRLANMVLVGALLARLPVLTLDQVEQALRGAYAGPPSASHRAEHPGPAGRGPRRSGNPHRPPRVKRIPPLRIGDGEAPGGASPCRDGFPIVDLSSGKWIKIPD